MQGKDKKFLRHKNGQHMRWLKRIERKQVHNTTNI